MFLTIEEWNSGWKMSPQDTYEIPMLSEGQQWVSHAISRRIWFEFLNSSWKVCTYRLRWTSVFLTFGYQYNLQIFLSELIYKYQNSINLGKVQYCCWFIFLYTVTFYEIKKNSIYCFTQPFLNLVKCIRKRTMQIKSELYHHTRSKSLWKVKEGEHISVIWENKLKTEAKLAASDTGQTIDNNIFSGQIYALVVLLLLYVCHLFAPYWIKARIHIFTIFVI